MRNRIEPQSQTIMPQRSFASAKYPMKKLRKRGEKSHAGMQVIFPWAKLYVLIGVMLATSNRLGRRPFVESKMPLMYFLQQWCSLADETLEDVLCDSNTLREFVGMGLSRDLVLDTTTLLKVLQQLRGSDLALVPFDEIRAHLVVRVISMRASMILNAAIIDAPGSTKKKVKARDSEIFHTESGIEWHFGMMSRIGGDAHSGQMLLVVAMLINVNDGMRAGAFLHGREDDSFSDVGNRWVHKRENARAPWRQVSLRSGQCRQLDLASKVETRLERDEPSSVSSRPNFEQLFHLNKSRFGHKKVRYRSRAKHEADLFRLFGLANRVSAKTQLMVPHAMGAASGAQDCLESNRRKPVERVHGTSHTFSRVHRIDQPAIRAAGLICQLFPTSATQIHCQSSFAPKGWTARPFIEPCTNHASA